jgi:serine/threonine protein kinase
MASSLNHPHIVTVHDVGEFEGRQYLVMECVDGGTLKDWAKEKKRTPKEIAELLTGIADGLAAAHEAGILHRDIDSWPDPPTLACVGCRSGVSRRFSSAIPHSFPRGRWCPRRFNSRSLHPENCFKATRSRYRLTAAILRLPRPVLRA